MSLALTFTDDALRRQRSARVARLVRVSAIAAITVCLLWLAFALQRGYLLVAAVEAAGILGSMGLLRVLRSGRTKLARHLAMVVLLLLVVSVVGLEGNGVARYPVVHLYLLCLAVCAYVFFFDAPPAVPASYALGCFALFLARELGWLTFAPLGPDNPSVALLATHVAFSALFLIVLALTWTFVRDIAVAERQLAVANERLEVLLESMLPKPIARRLRQEGHTFADSCPTCTMLFADIVGFTRMASQRTPSELVALLDDLFSSFDTLTEQVGAEKIKTIGDAYMAVAGLPEARSDHASAIARLALAMQRAAQERGIGLRIGINTGPVVAGVIGKKRFIYDIWGDAVNVAVDFETSASAGGIHLTEATRHEIGPGFALEDRGEVEVRSGQRIRAWALTGANRSVG